MKPRKAVVHIKYEDGSERLLEGMVIAREMRSEGEVEFEGGKRKKYPVSWTDFRVIREDQTQEVMDGQRRP